MCTSTSARPKRAGGCEAVWYSKRSRGTFMGWFDTINAATKGVKKGMGDDERKKIAADIVLMSSFGAAAVTIAPIPGSDFFLTTPLQAAMVMAVGRVYGRTL